MVDQEIFSRRLDALDLYLERVERLGDLVALRVWAAGKL